MDHARANDGGDLNASTDSASEKGKLNRYLFAVGYRDLSDGYVGFVLVEASGESAELASQEIEQSKGDRGWLLAAFHIRDPEELDGIVVGDHVVIATVSDGQREQTAATR